MRALCHAPSLEPAAGKLYSQLLEAEVTVFAQELVLSSHLVACGGDCRSAAPRSSYSVLLDLCYICVIFNWGFPAAYTQAHSTHIKSQAIKCCCKVLVKLRQVHWCSDSEVTVCGWVVLWRQLVLGYPVLA